MSSTSTYRTRRAILDDIDGPDADDLATNPLGVVSLAKVEPLNEGDDAPF